MTDKEFLSWIHDRIVHVYDEDKNVDFMWKLRSIIGSIDSSVTTKNVISSNSEENN